MGVAVERAGLGTDADATATSHATANLMLKMMPLRVLRVLEGTTTSHIDRHPFLPNTRLHEATADAVSDLRSSHVLSGPGIALRESGEEGQCAGREVRLARPSVSVSASDPLADSWTYSPATLARGSRLYSD